MILPLALAVLPSLQTASAPRASTEALGAKDQKDLSALVGLWFKACDAKKGVSEARDKLAKGFADVAKRMKIDPLACVADLRKIVEGAVSYSADDLSKGDETWKKYGEGKERARYAYRLPRNYLPNAQAWPLVLAIPEAGQDAKGYLDARGYLASAWKSDSLRDSTILVAPEMPANPEDWKRLEEGRPVGVSTVMFSLGDALRTFRIDRDRVVVVGSGKGGALAVTLASYYPDRFAGVVSREGGAEGAVLENLGSVPSYFSGDSPDLKKVQERMKELGRENGTFAGADDLEGLVKWIAARAREATPPEIVFVPAQHFTRNAYWTKVEKYDPPKDVLAMAAADRPILRGKIDRDTNGVEFEARGIYVFFLFLSDAMLDLDKPIRVTINGKEWNGTFKREIDKFLDLLLQRNDPRAIYTAVHVCTVPPPGAAEKKTGEAEKPK